MLGLKVLPSVGIYGNLKAPDRTMEKCIPPFAVDNYMTQIGVTDDTRKYADEHN